MTHWATGETTGVRFPADPDTFRAAGPEFLTEALHAFGTLPPENRVQHITRLEPVTGGSTGRKARLDVEYVAPCELPTQLFVKFSRDFDDPRRDRGKSQMEREVAFGQLSARTDLPVAVPVCLFADFESTTDTGILLTGRIAYGMGQVEPHYDKCLDYRIPEVLAHYRALLGTLAKVAGTFHRAALCTRLADEFSFDTAKVTVGKRVHYTAAEQRERVQRLTAFASAHHGLLPAVPADDLLNEVTGIAAREDAVMAWLHGTDSHLALCHWNANIDNAWFWRDSDGGLQCGLMDWGCASVMNVAVALWGCLCGAETWLWDQHLDELLDHFATEFTRVGGPVLDVSLVREQLVSYAVTMGVTWLLDVPAYVQAAIPDLVDVQDRHDPRIAGNEPVRAQLQMLSNVLAIWTNQDISALGQH